MIIKLLAMHKQTENKTELLNAIHHFHHELINEDLMLSHKMQGENHQRDLAALYELYAKSFDFSGSEIVSQYHTDQIVPDLESNINFFPSQFQFQNPDTFKRLFALIGENGQGIGTSAFADWVKNATALDLPPAQKSALDDFIDQCYADMDDREF